MGELKFARKVRSTEDVLADKVFAALETGNQAEARLGYKVLSETYPEYAYRLSVEVRKEYGVVL